MEEIPKPSEIRTWLKDTEDKKEELLNFLAFKMAGLLSGHPESNSSPALQIVIRSWLKDVGVEYKLARMLDKP